MTPLLQGMFFLFLFFGLLLPCLALSQEGLGVSDKGGFYGNMGPEDEAEHEPDSLKPAPQGYVKSVVGLFFLKKPCDTHQVPAGYHKEEKREQVF